MVTPAKSVLPESTVLWTDRYAISHGVEETHLSHEAPITRVPVSFYSDYRNRSISIADAVWLVLNSIAGTPQDKLDKMIESFRRNANP